MLRPSVVASLLLPFPVRGWRALIPGGLIKERQLVGNIILLLQEL